MITSVKFWDKVAARYSKQPIKNIEAYEQTMDRTRAYLSEDSEVLEVGCGTGSTALLLSKYVNRITGTDISNEMVRIATDKLKDGAVDNVEFIQAEADSADLKDETFDAVLAYNLIHLLPNPIDAMRRVHKVLKPNGIFISKTVCLGDSTSLWRIPIFFMQLVRYAPFVNFFTSKEVEAIVKQSGFEIVEARSFVRSPSSWFIVARKV